jgi:single-strand DNA-binding protein
MPSFNQVILAGNAVKDPETRFVGSSGSQVTSWGIAVNRQYVTNGEKREEVMFIDCTAWGKLGEIVSQYVSKGSPILVSGRLRLEQWQNDAGEKRSKHVVVADAVQFLGRKGDASGAPEPDDGDDIPF